MNASSPAPSGSPRPRISSAFRKMKNIHAASGLRRKHHPQGVFQRPPSIWKVQPVVAASRKYSDTWAVLNEFQGITERHDLVPGAVDDYTICAVAYRPCIARFLSGWGREASSACCSHGGSSRSAMPRDEPTIASGAKSLKSVCAWTTARQKEKSLSVGVVAS